MLIFLYEPPSLLEQRFKKTSVKKDSFSTNVIISLQELIKPLARLNSQKVEFRTKNKKLLLQAGYASTDDDVFKYDTKRLLNVVIVGVFCTILLLVDYSINMITVSLLLIYLSYKWPDMKLKKQIKFRQKEFMKYLPDAVDLLSICIQAGLGLDASFQKVADEFKLTSATVSLEFSRLNKDILSGLNREDVYRNLILRNESQDLQSFVALLIQTDRLGTSITKSLESFCDTMRTRKRQRIEELSQQASTKMTIPMVLFMLPAIFIIIMYPAIQKITTNLGH